MERKKDYLLCIDSDGCVMDSMDIKHKNCFAPVFVKEWQLEEFKTELEDKWNEFNLYSKTRGVNRFKGLLIILKYVDENIVKVEGIEDLNKWIDSTNKLSESSLIKFINEDKLNSKCLEKALNWSREVNKSIKALDESLIKPFKNAKEAIRDAKDYCDIVVVSSANREAVINEWERYGILQYTDDVMAQDSGTKAECIKKLLELGYKKENVLFLGDAVGDLTAASKNGVYFCPIIVRKEEISWSKISKIINDLIEQRFNNEYQKELEKEFFEALS